MKKITINLPKELCDYCTELGREKGLARNNIIYGLLEIGKEQVEKKRKETKQGR